MQNWLSLPNRQTIKRLTFQKQLSLAQKALVHWAKVDDYTAVLDMDCSNGKLLEYYLNRYHLRACGISSSAEELNASQTLLNNKAEVLRADKHDIPFRSSSFDNVFISEPFYDLNRFTEVFDEVKRVIKPGGQVVIAVAGHHLLSRIGHRFKNRSGIQSPENPFHLMQLLHRHGFTDVSMRLSSFQYATVLAYSGSPKEQQ
ncbi:MAG: class I SAM-dependent methyltransferase [Bacillota bacterium]|nr:class I SAM-dependent methyltransferase [Bacillota bacterium]